jgi:serine protease Do
VAGGGSLPQRKHSQNDMKRVIAAISMGALAGWCGLIGTDTTSAQQVRDRQPTRDRQQNRENQPSRDRQENGKTAQAAPERAGVLPKIKQDTTPLASDVKARSSFAPIAKKIAPNVVNVYSTRTIRDQAGQNPLFNEPFFRRFFRGGEDEGPSARPHTQQGLGSGVIVSDDGYIITNNHVVEDASDVRVALIGGDEFPAKVVGTDPATDIAVLKVDRTGLPAVTFADSAQLEVGDTVLAVGNPFGIGQTVTAGIVSGLGRGSIGIVDYEDFIQTDASINPGNSGGALTDVLGRLVGINTAILSRTGGNQGVGFAVPVNIALNVMEQIIQHGHVTRGYLGIYIQPLTPALAKAFDLPEHKGALVASVSPRSPAAQAGIKEGDVITEFNGKPITDSRQLRLMVAQTPPDTKADVRYLRGGKEQDAKVTLGELPKQELAQAQGGGGSSAQSGKGAFVEGMQVSELDQQTRRQLNIPNDVNGLVVTDVDSGSAAERAGLREGDVIEEVNREPVRSLRDATSHLRSQGGSVLLRVWSNGSSHYVALETGSQPKTKERQ